MPHYLQLGDRVGKPLRDKYRKDEVARSETRMNSSVLESCTQAGTDSLNDIDQVVVVSYI
jgi:dihydropteroate synthase